MINGVLYATAGEHRNAVAINAATGELLWMHRLEEGRRAEASVRRLSGRGVGYWTDGKADERIFYVTIGYQLVGLDAKTGHPLKDFGTNGVVDLKKDADQELDPVTGEIAWNGAPVVARNVVIVGASHRAGTAPRSKTNAKGYVRGYDARTGKRLWTFHTIPRPGEFGNETWLEDSWAYTGNTGVWTQITVDEELGIAYLPVEIPTGDYFGGHRPGNNLFSESLVAVDLETGKRIWHLPARSSRHLGLRHPVRADPGRHHRQRQADQGRRAADETGLGLRVRSQDRRAGVADRRAAGRERRGAERMVCADAALPDQAAGVRASGLSRIRCHRLHAGAQGRSAEDRVAVQDRPDLHAADHARRGRQAGLLYVPNGANWPGGSLDPETGMLYVFSHTLLRVLSLVNDAKRSDMNYISDGWRRRGRRRRAERAGVTAGKAAMGPHHRDRSQQGRHRLAGRARRHARRGQESPCAEGR